MSYKALYRTYRSQTFEELVGQKAIVKTLTNALLNNKISHAYLFSGPRGTGKTSIARLFAKALNCEDGVGHICNSCDNCKSITEGSHPDVIEIDAASNSGVDEVRDLIEKVKYSPIKGRYKIYIIDEVHMMTNSAFNALLKTLEEPPQYVVFILCTTEPHKLLPTILSRCQRYEFKKIDDQDLTSLIERVLNKEKIKADKDAIRLLVELANGGARDALSLLEQVIAFSSSYISVKDIESIFGLSSLLEKINLLKLIKEFNTLEVLNLFQKFLERNIDISRLTNELLLLLKDALIYKNTNSISLLTYNNELEIKEISNIFSINELNTLISLFIECQKEFKITNNPSFTFEIYLLKALSFYSSTNPTKEEIIIQKEELPKEVIKEEKEIIKDDHPLKELEIEKPKEVKKETKKEIDIFNPEEELLNDKEEDKKGEITLDQVKFYQNPVKVQPKVGKLKIIGTANYINDENIIKMLVTANKNARTELLSIFKNKLEDFVDDKTYSECAQILIDSNIFALTKKEILLVSDYDKNAIEINIKENQNLFSDLIFNLSKKKLFVYALNRKRCAEIKKTFLSLSQVNKLPRPDDVDKIEILEEEIY